MYAEVSSIYHSSQCAVAPLSPVTLEVLQADVRVPKACAPEEAKHLQSCPDLFHRRVHEENHALLDHARRALVLSACQTAETSSSVHCLGHHLQLVLPWFACWALVVLRRSEPGMVLVLLWQTGTSLQAQMPPPRLQQDLHHLEQGANHGLHFGCDFDSHRGWGFGWRQLHAVLPHCVQEGKGKMKMKTLSARTQFPCVGLHVMPSQPMNASEPRSTAVQVAA